MQEVKEFWTELVRNQEADNMHKLRASENIAKTNGAFIDKVEHSGKIDIIKRAKEIEEQLFGDD